MRIINPDVECIPQSNNTLNGIYKQIELAGRTCYKSEDKITENSAKEFVDRMIKSNHTAMLEHGTVYLTLKVRPSDHHRKVHYPWYYDNAEVNFYEVFSYVQSLFMSNPYTKISMHTNEELNETTMCITTNYRVIIENGLEHIMKEFISEPTEYHIPRITLKFTTNIGVTREGNRMRANSIAEESTRYCNYSKDKFNKQITFCKPVWIKQGNIDAYAEQEMRGEFDFDDASNEFKCISIYLNCLFECQKAYNKLIELGWAPQQAREILPLATKSDVVYTAFPHQWRHFFDLRLFGKTGVPHPNMKDIATKAAEVLLDNDLWKLIYPGNEPIPAHVGENN